MGEHIGQMHQTRARDVLLRTQEEDGSWRHETGGPLFLSPMYVACLYVMGRAPDARTRDGLLACLRNHQNEDGGWGLDVESPSFVFTTVLNYVALRLMGVDASDPDLRRAREWFLPRGGPLSSGSWGKLVLALLGLYSYEGVTPVLPELWLLPKRLPFHPSRIWPHCRMVYLPMGWLYGQRARMAETPLLAELRRELYAQPYEDVDWAAARDRVAPSDAYIRRGGWLRVVDRVMGLYERFHSKRLRARALDESLELIRGEDEATKYRCLGPVNKLLDTVVWHLARPGGPELRAHLEHLPDYLQYSEEGVDVTGWVSSQLWDTAFSVQALVATELDAGTRHILARAGHFLEQQQILADAPHAARIYRQSCRGGWPFSIRDNGWAVSDCTAEAVKACLLLEPLGLNRVPRERLAWAIEFILSLQNPDGGWSTYERKRAPRWLERLSPLDVFDNFLVDPSHVECTSACIQALVAWRRGRPGAPVDDAIARGMDFLRRAQHPNGGWEGLWGVYFSYGTWFAVSGLVAAGVRGEDPALRRAVAFLRSHQREDGSWSETVQGCRERRWVDGPTGHAVTTSWTLMALMGAGELDSEAVRRGVRWLRERQHEDGGWPREPLAGVFSRSCAVHYGAYLRVFPLWALALAERRTALPRPGALRAPGLMPPEARPSFPDV